jgi:hypothetical protein
VLRYYNSYVFHGALYNISIHADGSVLTETKSPPNSLNLNAGIPLRFQNEDTANNCKNEAANIVSGVLMTHERRPLYPNAHVPVVMSNTGI